MEASRRWWASLLSRKAAYVLLLLTSLFGGNGVQLYCFLQVRQSYEGGPTVLHVGRLLPAQDYYLMAGISLAWLLAWFVFAGSVLRTPRWIGLALIALAVFVFGAWQTLTYAYPVCNPF